MATRRPYANEAVDEATLEISRVVRAAIKRLHDALKARLADLDREDGKVLRSVENARSLNAILDGLQQLERESGFQLIADKQVEVLRSLVDEVLSESKRLGIDAPLDAVTAEDIRTLLGGSLRTVEALEREGAQGLERLLAKSITGRLGWKELDKKVVDELDKLDQRTSTQLSAAIAGFHTQVRTEYFSQPDETGEPLVTWWIYDGPRDDRNRDFCSHFVGTRVTLAILDEHATSFGRDFPAPPSVSLGGYNCRHQLIPIVEPEVLDQFEEGPR